MANLGATSLEKKVFYSDPVPSTDSGPNLSAKFKNPRVKQSIPDAGRGQYE